MRSEPAVQPRDIATALSTLLAAYYGARQLVRDLERFPHAISAVERARIEGGTARLEATLGPLAERIGKTALSPERLERLAESVPAKSADASEWRLFMASVQQLRDATGRASRTLRLRKGTDEFVLGTAADEGATSAAEPDGDTRLSLRRLNRKLLALEILAGVERPASRPLRVLVDVTNKCNFRCRTCYQSNSQDFVYYDLARAPFENLRPFLDVAEVVNFAGTGEPLLSPDTPELIRIAATTGVQTELVTNGSLFHRLKGLEEHLSRVFLSFDGASPKTVDTIRKGARFDSIVADLRAMPDVLRRKICFNMVVCRVNVHEIATLARLARSLGVAALHLQAFHPYLPWHDAMALREEDLGLLAEQVAAARRELDGSGMTFNVTFPVDSVPAPAHPSGTPVPEQEEILLQLKRVATAFPHEAESWDTMSRRFEECAALALPVELVSALEEQPEAPRPLADTNPASRLQARIDALLARLDAAPRIHVPACLAPHSLLYLVGDGTTRPCCILDTRTGDLHSEPAEHVWHSSAAVALRKNAAGHGSLPSSCDGCVDGGRFGFLHELLLEAQGLGVDMTKVVLPSDSPVPAGVVRWLAEVQTRATTDWTHARGHLDVVRSHFIAGWAYHPDLDHAQVVDIFVDGDLVHSVAAMQFREDLKNAGIGDGRHGFETYIPEHFVDGRTHEIQVRFCRTGKHLTGSPRLVVLAK
jgi:MoaA/NifB/PqqE/SkfB family radical SAM enzyme